VQGNLTAGHTCDLTIEYFQGTGDAIAQFGYITDMPQIPADDRERIASADGAIVLVHTHNEESMDRPYALPMDQERLINTVVAENPHTIVLLESGGNVAMKNWGDQLSCGLSIGNNMQTGIAVRSFLLFWIVACSSAAGQSWQMVSGHIATRWAKDVSPNSALPEYPRPQMVREQWQSLNGLWDFTLSAADQTDTPAAYDGKILVPFPYESALSGVGKPSIPHQRIWYHRTFSIPDGWRGQRVLLHFGAVNWEASVVVNGEKVGAHRGGFDGFAFDITDRLKPGMNDLTVGAMNPMITDAADAQVVGKQRVYPSGIFYTGSTGIWQSVWIEPVPAIHISSMTLVPDIDNHLLRVIVSVEGGAADAVEVTALDGTTVIATVSGLPGKEIAMPITDPHLWSTDDPYLYGLRVKLVGDPKHQDAVGSYFAMRKVSVGKDEKGRPRILLNNKFVLQVGVLDQGYWPDGIYTAPTDDALKSDIVTAKSLGFNLLRKHAKVEPDRWYYWTDKLGMIVWQDMPQCFDKKDANGTRTLSEAAKAQWLMEWTRILAERINHPSIIVWTTFNEGWGQHDTESIVALTKEFDPSRLVNNASGWNDMNVGDMRDMHAYPGPSCEISIDGRASVNGEFGGLTMRIADHMWTSDLFGYGATLKSGWKLTQKYQQLLQTAYRMRDERAASAFVYTQLTDVERESNGLLTYDRAVVKPLEEFIAAANRGEFPPLPPPPVSHDLLPTSEEVPQAWSYTVLQPPEDWMQPAFDASHWKTGQAPFGRGYAHNTEWSETPGDIWIRREFQLPAEIPKTLSLTAIHDEDVEIYFNGVLAASAKGFVRDYVELAVAKGALAALRPGSNVIAVHCRQTTGGQVIDVGLSAGD
jgi:hypothetical protein